MTDPLEQRLKSAWVARGGRPEEWPRVRRDLLDAARKQAAITDALTPEPAADPHESLNNWIWDRATRHTIKKEDKS